MTRHLPKFTVAALIVANLAQLGIWISDDHLNISLPVQVTNVARRPSGHPGTPLASVRVGGPGENMGSGLNLAIRAAEIDEGTGEIIRWLPGREGGGTYIGLFAFDHNAEQEFLGGYGARWRSDPEPGHLDPELVQWIKLEDAQIVSATMDRDGWHLFAPAHERMPSLEDEPLITLGQDGVVYASGFKVRRLR